MKENEESIKKNQIKTNMFKKPKDKQNRSRRS